MSFTALSYVWGDVAVTKNILLAGYNRAVTTNLESALRNFWRYAREDEENSIADVEGIDEHKGKDDSEEKVHYLRAGVGAGKTAIWVDAVCINQDDLVEKRNQISLMRDIYAEARCVFSWLGEPNGGNVDWVLKTIRSIAPHLKGLPVSNLEWLRQYPELENTDFK